MFLVPSESSSMKPSRKSAFPKKSEHGSRMHSSTTLSIVCLSIQLSIHPSVHSPVHPFGIYWVSALLRRHSEYILNDGWFITILFCNL